MEPLQPGTRIGTHVIERLLSDKGGFSLVYRARHPHHGAVAIKECAIAGQADRRGTIIVPRPERRADFEWTRARFRQEARFLLGNGRHSHIVHALEMIEANDTVYLAMELLAESLDQRLQREGRQSVDTIARWLDPIGRALIFCEAQGCHHLDIAPKNIMFDQAGQAKLIDFGFSRLGNASRLRSTRLATTDGYSPVEKYSFSSRDLDARSDVYSLAATLVRALADEEPIDARIRPGDGAHRFVSPEGERAIRAAAGAQGYTVLERALAVQKSDRYASVATFLEAWNASLQQRRLKPGSSGQVSIDAKARPAPAATPAKSPAKPKLPPAIERDKRRKIAMLCVLIAIAVLVIIWTVALS